MKAFSAMLAAAAAIKVKHGLKMASVSDLHLFPFYSPTSSSDAWCWPSDTEIADEAAYFGRWGCDPPEELIRVVLQELKDQNPELDVIFMPGDLVAHNISGDLEDPNYGTSYEDVLSVIGQVGDLMAEYFPGAILVPAIGNNDTKYHYQPPIEVDGDDTGGKDYLKYYFEAIFANHPRTSQLPELSQIRETWMQGGFYRVQLGDNLHAIGLETLMFNDRDLLKDKSEQVQQLIWLTDQLNESGPEDRFILVSHIYESGSFWEVPLANWEENGAQSAFYRALWANRDKILVEITGHDHLSDLRAHKAGRIYNSKQKCAMDLQNQDSFLPKLVTPGVTPGNWSNPGYSTFEWDGSNLTNLKSTFLQLDPTIGKPQDFSDFEFWTLEMTDFEMSLVNASEIQALGDRLQADHELAKTWMHSRRGFPEYNDLCLYGDVHQQGYAQKWATQETIFTSLESGLLQYFCLQQQDMYTGEMDACIRHVLEIPACP